ncbi:MAG: glycosyltransferase family 2 protein [gamma proteobacterium symbiont of Bathyaustriella thionipta]|nr:glycosyltransferase family 2 protein [gamma proteobacterium symbiont of Bathyaustriella thionipta]
MVVESHISIVVPVYGCEESLVELCQRLKKTVQQITNKFEIILINDASPDCSWEVICELARKDKRVKGINLSKNYGQHCAISAGIDNVNARWLVVMDCDLQDQPEEILKLYEKAQEGYEQVVAVREVRKDHYFIKLSSRLFYILFNYLSDTELDNRVANFGIYSRKVVSGIKKFKEKDRSFGLLASLTGFKKTKISVEHAERKIGRSSYSFRKRLNMALNHILSHSNKPLLLAVKMGFVCSLAALFYTVWLILRYFFLDEPVEGWTSVMVSLFFLSGMVISVVGVVGLYVGKIYNEVKERPLYIIDEVTFKNTCNEEILCQKK